MQKEITKKPEIKLIGLTARTNNKNEMNPATAKIGALMGQYFGSGLGTSGIIYSVYTDYESDENGDYTYFIGEEVPSFENVPENMQTLVIPASQYTKFTTAPGQMPQVVINAWQSIWQMTASDFGAPRAYIADFEIYDQRAVDPTNSVVDIYIGIK